MTYVGFAVMVASWLAFATLLVRAPATLDGAWRSVRALPYGIEVVAWVLFLPWMLALAAWERRGWPQLLRAVAVVCVAGAWIVVFFPRGG